MATATARNAPRRRASQTIGSSGIRWDRLGRVGLLTLLGIILLLYISPAKHWFEQSRTASAQAEELQHLEAENARLAKRAALLKNPDTLEQEARKLGMVRVGERSYVIENPPKR
jgi:cell division protein FtsB